MRVSRKLGLRALALPTHPRPWHVQVLTGYPDAPNWVLILANCAIAVHMMSAWQASVLGRGSWGALAGRPAALRRMFALGCGFTSGLKSYASHLLSFPSSRQVFAQPVFDTIESHVKAWTIRRQQAAALQLGGASASGADRLGSIVEEIESADAGSGALEAAKSAALGNPLDASKLEGGGVVAAEQLGNPLGSRLMSVRMSSGGIAMHNSCPIPDLLPPSGTFVGTGCAAAGACTACWTCAQAGRPAAALQAGASSPASGATPPTAACHPTCLPRAAAWRARGAHAGFVLAELCRQHTLPWVLGLLTGLPLAIPLVGACSNIVALGRLSMFAMDTGAANERVPLNESGYFIPFWQVSCCPAFVFKSSS